MDTTGNQLVTFDPFLSLSSPKRDYQKGEDVIVVVALANFTQRPLVVNKRLQMIFDYKYREAYELQFDIVGPDEMPLVRRSITEDRLWPYPRAEDFAELLPTKRWEKEVRLSRYFSFSEIGRYLVTVEYHNDHDGRQFGVDAWTGRLRSSSIEIVVQESGARLPAGALPQATSRGERRTGYVPRSASKKRVSGQLPAKLPQAPESDLIQFVLKELTRHSSATTILALLDPGRIWSEPITPQETLYTLYDANPPRPEHIRQSWIAWSGQFEECSPEKYLEYRGRKGIDHTEFAILEHGDSVRLVWEGATAEGLFGHAGACVLQQVDNHWAEAPNTRWDGWIS